MRAILTALALTLAVPIAGCSQGASEAESVATISVTITAKDRTHRFNVEVARTNAEQDKGLMFRTSLPADGGMLFPFEKPRIGSFWMKNTLIPLDMIFIDAKGKIISIAANTKPMSTDTILSGGQALGVLEIAGGSARLLGIKPGDTVVHPMFGNR